MPAMKGFIQAWKQRNLNKRYSQISILRVGDNVEVESGKETQYLEKIL